MEQVNSWFSKYSSVCKYMNRPRFDFFVLLVSHLNNKYRVYKRINHIDNDDEQDKDEDEPFTFSA